MENKKYYFDKNHPEYGIFDSEELGNALKVNNNIIEFTVEQLASVLGSEKSGIQSAAIMSVSEEVVPKDILAEYSEYDFIVFSDGGTTGQGGPGGYGAVTINCETGEVHEIMQAFKSTTNNRMELMATIEGLNAVPDNTNVIVIADSNYVVKHLDGSGWSRNNNDDLWPKADAAIKKKKKVDFQHEYGHGEGSTFESKWNNRCDKLSNIAREKLDLIDDEGYEG